MATGLTATGRDHAILHHASLQKNKHVYLNGVVLRCIEITNFKQQGNGGVPLRTYLTLGHLVFV